MQQKSDNNHQQPKIDLPPSDRIASKSLGELDSLLLEKAFIGQDSSELAYPTTNLSFKPQQALYITEIGDKFYFLDYTTGEQNPQPNLLKSGNILSLNDTRLTTIATPKTELDLAKTTSSSDKKTAFLTGKKGILIGVGLGVLLTMGTSRILFAPTASNEGESATPTAVESVAPPQAVTVVDVETTSIDSVLDSSGTVRAFERTPVMSQAAGLQITEVLAERGDYVDRGKVLARLNNRALLAQKTEAEAAVAQAQSALDELQAGNRVEEIAQAEARVANAQSAVTQAESDLELIQTRVERNRELEREGAIARDRFDEILNQERVAESTLAGAQANLKEAQQALAQAKAGSRRQTIAQAEAQLLQAQGRLAGIEAQLADTIITAPSSGLIASREARVGQITSTSEMLFTIVQNGRLELNLQIPETSVNKVVEGQKVKITSNADANLNLTGTVREIDPTIDDSSRQALVKVELLSNANLKPGMFLQAAINTDTNQGLAVPIEALLPQARNKATAFVLQTDNTVKAQTVEMGEIIDSQKVEVVDGLQSGDRIVLKGAAYLKDGDRVKISQ